VTSRTKPGEATMVREVVEGLSGVDILVVNAARL
jgi:hypothetical protein